MLKIRDVLRLKFETGQAQCQIARNCRLGKTTVSECLARFERSGLSWSEACPLEGAPFMELAKAHHNIRRMVRLYSVEPPPLLILTYLFSPQIARMTSL